MLASRRAGRGRRVRAIVVDEHRLGQSIVALVREGQQHALTTTSTTDLARATGKDQRGRLAALAPHLELAPVDAEAQAGAESLESSLLGREARGEVLSRITTSPAVGDLPFGEDATEEPVLPSRDHLSHAPDVDDVDPDAPDDHAPRYATPIRPRMTAASSSAIAVTRSTSGPSTMTRASGSVPE
jgi:hypothetical protein